MFDLYKPPFMSNPKLNFNKHHSFPMRNQLQTFAFYISEGTDSAPFIMFATQLWGGIGNASSKILEFSHLSLLCS